MARKMTPILLPQNIRWAGHTDIGKTRKINQDSIGIFPEIGLFVVADGMGGHAAGEIASQLAVATLRDLVKDQMDNEGQMTLNADVLKRCIKACNDTILKKSTADVSLAGMGTTITAVLVTPVPNSNRRTSDEKSFRVLIGQVGDSRCYLFRSGDQVLRRQTDVFSQEAGLWQLSIDHSLVHEKVKAGIITRQAARTDRQRNVLTRSLGVEFDVQVDVFEREILDGDIYMLCSDGVTTSINDFQIFETLSKHESKIGKPLANHATQLVACANEHGGSDNISAVLLGF